MKLTANELRHRCIDGEQLRLKVWPHKLFVYYDYSDESITLKACGGIKDYRPYWDMITNADKYDWEQVIEKKPFPFKEGEPVWFDKTLKCIDKGFYEGLSNDKNYFLVRHGSSVVICKTLYKYELTFNPNSESVNAEDLHMYDLEVE